MEAYVIAGAIGALVGFLSTKDKLWRRLVCAVCGAVVGLITVATL